MATSFVSFGPDLEPLEDEARRGARTAGPRRDGLTVSGTSEEVISRLRDSSEGWCKLEQVLAGGGLRNVYVNAGAVRFVVDEDDPEA